ncbi:MAG: GNAT family N-acetyltransferase [Methylococcaceae bacterium]|jgi:ribosomal protein S18 acetylase RimI-like enzyme
MKPFSVRLTQLSDLDVLSTLFDSYRQFYGRASDLAAAKEFLLARISQEESVSFIAYTGDTAIGFTQLYPSFSSVSLARVYILNDLFVTEAARRQGAASLLIANAISYAGSKAAVRVSLSTATTNAAAQALYQSLGWQRDEQFLVYHFAIGQ